MLSHDDQHGLILAAMMGTPNEWATKIFVPTHLIPGSKLDGLWRMHQNLSLPVRMQPIATISSGLHLEVANCLKDIGIKCTSEVGVGAFVVDLVVV